QQQPPKGLAHPTARDLFRQRYSTLRAVWHRAEFFLLVVPGRIRQNLEEIDRKPSSLQHVDRRRRMIRKLVVVLLGMIVLVASGANAASTTTITWHGHAAFEIGTPNGVVILIDPWLTNPANPAVKENKDPLEHVKKVDYILITNGHFDHAGDAVAIAKQTGTSSVSN